MASHELLFMFTVQKLIQLLLAPDDGTRTKSSSSDKGSLQSSQEEDQGAASSRVKANAVMSRPTSSNEKDVSSSKSSHCIPGEKFDVGD